VNNYRSKFEKQIHTKLLPHAEYEPYSIDYVTQHKYTPDFVHGNKVYEAKGFFREGDITKYIAVNKQLKELGKEFIFILQKPNKPVRKGAKLTMSKWCEKHNIKWITV